ncbi:phosphoglycerate kinase PGKI [Cardiosporidium cionae]|uniref:Phosphoglycerate kinase n=1 Tax=Cardiosporidium cionae TaxID=476202 RepID=A0ABQ7JDF2_9APIC|nr:phosphoglycerate kinase PGKI [Cardiosporidium cionae]|eukprot:KAF8821973.1 phosphoglycerate kinase PGKI [Cardiosporidium cionae]
MLSQKLNIEDIADQLNGKRVLIRVDFNVPLLNGKVTDTTRIVATIPTIQYVISKGAASIILMSHCGRPNGRVQSKYSLRPVESILSNILQREVLFLEDCVGTTVEVACRTAKPGAIILLENLRYHIEEESKGEDANGAKLSATKEAIDAFREALTRLGDIFINDAFGTAHRAHSSMVGIQVPLRAAGLLMKRELEYFGQVMESPRKPFLAILGGAKVQDKIKLIFNLLDRVNMMIVGGGMAFTFKKVLSLMSIGKSLYDEEGAKIVRSIVDYAKEKNVELLLPVDFVCGDKFDNSAQVQLCDDSTGIPDGWMGLDCGPKTLEQAKHMILRASTIVWNGPQGVFEVPQFSHGSLAFLDYVVESTQKGAVSIVGGGDTVALIEGAGKSQHVSHVSTGGGASLELLEGKQLPGVAALSSRM